jgi:hypothetical protein
MEIKNLGTGIDLSDINLVEAKLMGVNLFAVNLLGANLAGADLRNANLRGTNLSQANLRKTNFDQADLWKAKLVKANLRYTSLKGADLTEVSIGDTIFGETDLSNTKGLEYIFHYGPSLLGISTLQLSKGKVPEAFLRGCGLSDWEIESAKLYRPGLSPEQVTDITYKVCQLRAGNPLQYYSCFISYSSKDDEFAKRLYDDLQNNGVRCWFASEDLKIGDKFRGRIDDAIRVHDKLLIVLSENSINSTWVEKEVETAFEKESKGGGTVLFPIRLDDDVMKTEQAWAADIRRTRHIGDFSEKDGYQKAFERLLRDLKATDAEA